MTTKMGVSHPLCEHELTLTDPRDFPLGRVFQPLMRNVRMAAGGAQLGRSGSIGGDRS